MADLASIVKAVKNGVVMSLSDDDKTRTDAEAQFQQFSMTKDGYGKLIYSLAEILKDTTPVAGVEGLRQQASILLQGFIKPRDPAKRPIYAKLWTEQSPAFKSQVKQQLTAAMGLPGPQNSALGRSAANCLVEIAILEIPTKHWPAAEFTKQMAALCVREEPDAVSVALRKNSVIVVGDVCDQLQTGHFVQGDVNTLLSAIVSCMSSNSPDVVAAAMAALANALKFVESNVQIKKQRDTLIGQLVSKGVQSANALVQERALQCFVRMCELYYKHMGEYMQGIMKLTIDVLKNAASEDGVKCQAIEVWNTLLEYELDHPEVTLNYMANIGLSLVPILMQGMIFRSEEIAMADDVRPERIARVTMRLLSTLIKSQKLLDTVMGLVHKCIALPASSWAQREMGFVAMGLVMEVGENPTVAPAIKPHIVSGVPQILNAIKQPSDHLITRDSALWALDRIFVFALNQFPNPQAAMTALHTALEIVKAPGQPARIVLRAVGAIKSYHKFFQHCTDAERQGVLTQFCPPTVHGPVLQAMLVATQAHKARLGEQNLGTNIFDCVQQIINVLDVAYSPATADANKQYFGAIHSTFTNLVRALTTTLEDSTMGKQLRDLYIFGYVSSLSACLLAFDKDEYRMAIVDRAGPLVQALLSCCFKIRGLRNSAEVQEEALLLTNRVVSIMQDKAEPFIPEIMKNMKAIIDLKPSQNETKLAIGLISEVYSVGWRNATQDAHDVVMGLLLQLIGDENLDRDTKPIILEAMSSMLGFLQDRFTKWVNHAKQILVGAMSVARPSGALTEEQAEDAEFVDKLRSEILIFITELLQVPAVSAAAWSDMNFQKRLYAFCTLLMQPNEANEEHQSLLAAMITDMSKVAATVQLHNSLRALPGVPELLAREADF